MPATPIVARSPSVRVSSEQRYLAAVEDGLARVVREASLVEPRVVDPDRAVRVLDGFLATMTGFALGSIARQLAGAMRSWFGAGGLATMRGALHRWPCELRLDDDAVVCDRERPLAGAALARLHVRFSLANREVRCLVDALPTKPMTSMMFDVLARDGTAIERIASELALGWRVFSAAVTGTPHPPRSALWRAWVRHLDGRPALTRDEVTGAGYIALVR